MQFALIPPGTFTMGSPADEKERGEEEDQSEVEITEAFYLGIHAVTQQQYQRVMADNPSYFTASGRFWDRVKGLDTSRFPVEYVSWKDASALNTSLGSGHVSPSANSVVPG
jgi:formylglycine-generating enzyme required for sulfatase activity